MGGHRVVPGALERTDHLEGNPAGRRRGARRATPGVDAIALSNHGGRQLDGAPPPIELVAPVADAVGGTVPRDL